MGVSCMCEGSSLSQPMQYLHILDPLRSVPGPVVLSFRGKCATAFVGRLKRVPSRVCSVWQCDGGTERQVDVQGLGGGGGALGWGGGRGVHP